MRWVVKARSEMEKGASMEYTVRELRSGDPRDAALLAELWNASDAAWPSGLTGGVPETAERVLDRQAGNDRLFIFVVEVAGHLIGYANLTKTRGQDGAASGGVLNVRPDWHGKGCGKALLRAILQRLAELGYRQLIASTWPGNMKGLPLYKKTGFFWEPGEDMVLRNFIPTALAMPVARRFFARHDWLESLRREIVLAPDDADWHGIKVYPYRFEAGRDLFAMWIDRRAQAPTAFETRDLYAACYTGRAEIVRGVKHVLTWEIVDKRASRRQPLRVTLVAKGDAGITLDVAETFEVAGALRFERPFTVSPDLVSPLPGLPHGGVRTVLLIDGIPTVLHTAVRAVEPITLDVLGTAPTPGKPDEAVIVRLRNRLRVAVSGEVGFGPRPGLLFDRQAAPFTLPPGSWTSCLFRLTAGPGAHPTVLRAVCPPEQNPQLGAETVLPAVDKPVTFHSVPFDRVYAWEDEDDEAAVIEAPTFQVWADLRSGGFAVVERLSERQVLWQNAPLVGPPFGDEPDAARCTHRIEQDDGRVRLVLSQPLQSLPGVVVERTLTVGAGPYLRLDHRLLNATGVEQRAELRCTGALQLHRSLTLPLAAGLVHETLDGVGDFPLSMGRDIPGDPNAWAESWMAREEQGLVAGIVWTACSAVDDGRLHFRLPPIPARAYAEAGPLYLVAARGDWQIVRGLWRALYQGGDAGERQQPQARPVLWAALEPGPPLLAGECAAVSLSVCNRRLKPWSGNWEVRAAELQIEPAAGELEEVALASPARLQLTLRCPDLTPRVVPAQVVLRSAITTETFDSPLVVVGDAGREVVVAPADGGARFEVDNGWLRFSAAPGHHGSLVSLCREGRETLLSSYPAPRPFAWASSWFGGVEPFLDRPGDTRYAADSFAGGPVARRGARGTIWHGVEAACRVRHLRWLEIAIEYLTTGGSNLVALVQRLTNASGAPQRVTVGFVVFPALAPGGRLHYDVPRQGAGASSEGGVRVRRARAPMPHGFRFGSAPWVAVEAAGSVLTLLPLNPEGEAGGWMVDPQTAGMQASSEVRLEPQETTERIAWLALTADADQAPGYQVLAALRELP
jgi:GNAT superfamily N-acetyltransferase